MRAVDKSKEQAALAVSSSAGLPMSCVVAVEFQIGRMSHSNHDSREENLRNSDYFFFF